MSQGSHEPDETNPNNFNKLQMEAIMAEIMKRMKASNPFIENSDNFYGQTSQARKEARRKRKGKRVATGETDGRDTSSGRSTDVPKSARAASQTRTHTNRAPRDTPDDSLGNLKLKIPSFSGSNDPDAFLEWEKKIELVFDCQNYSESKKVRLAATEFNGYALHWWDQIVTTRRRTGEPQVSSWFELKTIMRRRFVPGHYSREVHQKLRRLTQGSKSVEDYYQEMEILMLKAAVDEDSEATMARFLAGLNRDVQDRLELQEYVDIYELLHKAILIEKQMKRKLNPRASYGNTRPAYGKEDKVFVKPKEEAKAPGRNDQGKAPTTRTRDVKCFKCHGIGHYASECTNKKVMILLENGELISEDEQEEAAGEEVVDYPVHGELLITRRSLKVQSKPEEHDQRENLFHTLCLVYDKVCSLIIDGGSCTNVASESLVAKLGLQTGKHPKPYMLQWLNEDGELKVTEQVMVPITIGRYQDEIVWDVLPMDSSHLLLGRPWQYDKKAIHDGFTNRHSFTHREKNIVLAPLSPQEVHQDQVQLKLRKQEARDKGKSPEG
ncbi:hypothetical protein N665_1039s0001 [Sinapis alba]|nr:hypothetical protein N665_1039s0001 [Sinapis alba]